MRPYASPGEAVAPKITRDDPVRTYVNLRAR